MTVISLFIMVFLRINFCESHVYAEKLDPIIALSSTLAAYQPAQFDQQIVKPLDKLSQIEEYSSEEETKKDPQHDSHHTVRRVAFDIGSGQIKMQISDVDTIANKIARVLHVETVKIALREDLSKSLDEKLSGQIQKKILQVIIQLMKKAAFYHPEAYHAIATESFRIAKNGEDLAKKIKKKTGLPITIISPEEEGILGFISAMNETDIDSDKVIAWDFGGGSFQITTQYQNQYVVYQGKLGKVPFKNLILKIQGQDMRHTLSPNPISKEECIQAIQLLRESMHDIPFGLCQKLNDSTTVVLGIGIHPLQRMPRNTTFDKARILKEIKARLNLNDEAIRVKDAIGDVHKDSAAYIVSNLILAYGVMDALGIYEVRYIGTQGANAIGLLLSSKYWRDEHSIRSELFY